MSNLAIVCVDDQKMVLEGLKEQLKRGLGHEYELETAESGEEALEIIQELFQEGMEVALIISDQIMPGMEGDELLVEVNRRYPKMLKIMLTGQADAQAVGNAVNKANLYRYISKPWNETDLILTAKEALRSYVQERQLAEQNEQLQKLNLSLEQKVAERTLKLTQANDLLKKQIQQRERTELALRLAQQKSETLLLNILPKSIAEKLKQGKGAIAEQYDDVTILFADIVNFTNLASSMKPFELVKLLNEIFSSFDKLTEEHQLEKIKTIGDEYMVVGGLPLSQENHAEAIAEMALSMQQIITRFRTRQGKPFQIRIGINTGTVVAGVIGLKKFIYDLWGDAVNTASRMETSCIPGKIQVTEDTYKRLKEKFILEPRGKITVKGKGKMKTYWLKDKKSFL